MSVWGASICSAQTGLIRRMDGSKITVTEATTFAGDTLSAQHVTGAQLVVLNEGRVVWSEAFGFRRRAPDLPMTRETNTWAASITKSVFSTYVMQLVERREFDLDTPVARQLAKPLDQYEPYGHIAAVLVRDPAWAKVTPRMLLSHSSGLANFAFLEPDTKMRLHFEPGTRFRYSGEGMNVVQFLIEQKKGRPLDQLMQDALFSPLQMTRTGMVYRSEFADNVADRFDLDGKFVSQTRRSPARASGNMASSAEDLARLASALFGGKLLKKNTRREMFTPVVRIEDRYQFPFGPNEGKGTEGKAVGLAYGIGWGLLTKTRFGPAFFKEGHGDGAQNYMICFERSQTCMILLTNSDNGELAFRPLLEHILGDTVTPWEWEGYTPELIQASRANR